MKPLITFGAILIAILLNATGNLLASCIVAITAFVPLLPGESAGEYRENPE